MEENSVDDDERDDAPLRNLGPLVPHRLDGLCLNSSLKLALEAKLLLVGELAEGGRPLFFDAEAVARKVKGRQCVFVAAEQAVDEF